MMIVCDKHVIRVQAAIKCAIKFCFKNSKILQIGDRGRCSVQWLWLYLRGRHPISECVGSSSSSAPISSFFLVCTLGSNGKGLRYFGHCYPHGWYRWSSWPGLWSSPLLIITSIWHMNQWVRSLVSLILSC